MLEGRKVVHLQFNFDPEKNTAAFFTDQIATGKIHKITCIIDAARFPSFVRTVKLAEKMTC